MPQNTQYRGLILYTNGNVYKRQNLAFVAQHPDIKFERKSDWISVVKHAGTCHRWCIWRVNCGTMRTSIGTFRDMVLGVCIIFAKCISYNPNIDRIHHTFQFTIFNYHVYRHAHIIMSIDMYVIMFIYMKIYT